MARGTLEACADYLTNGVQSGDRGSGRQRPGHQAMANESWRQTVTPPAIQVLHVNAALVASEL
jgi:hypothetical protein